ncbi:hypothetical protein [Bogoriella caseilytica]|uniref:hypothetical protein n=1 Tax=Bogoriella caseilytica TaxID=56055 RepID=UPI0011CDFBC6|nr:hypothetical protein [Bogoriella caseilytica]
MRALIVMALIAGGVQLTQTPAHRPLDDLFQAIEAGEVSTITMEQLPPNSQGQSTVEWDGLARPAWSTYEYSSENAAPEGWAVDDPSVSGADERAMILDLASRSGVQVLERDLGASSGGHLVWFSGLAWTAALLLLIGGPRPRLASKWAWFWLAVATPITWLVFAILEPTLWGRRRPSPQRARRLSGGWGFLLALVIAGLLASIPWYRDHFLR